MDEATRKLEREAAEGNPQAVLRLARGYLHAGDQGAALAATEGSGDPAVLAFRAERLLAAEELTASAEAAGSACAAAPDALPTALAEELTRRLLSQLELGGREHDDDPIWVLRVAGLLAGIGRLESPASLTELEVEWPDIEPLVAALRARAPGSSSAGLPPLAAAIVRGATGVPPYHDEPVPTRLFSAHGPDFKSGTFVSFDAGCEDRLTYFESGLFRAIDALLPEADPEWEHFLAFGRGYGLAVERGAPTALLEERVARVNDARILPFPLVVHHHQPFDVLVGVEGEGPLSPEDQRLAWRFVEDLSRHPARMGNPADNAPYALLLGSFRRGNPEPEALDALLERCQQTYGPVGYAALERFAKRAWRENERMAARRAARP